VSTPYRLTPHTILRWPWDDPGVLWWVAYVNPCRAHLQRCRPDGTLLTGTIDVAPESSGYTLVEPHADETPEEGDEYMTDDTTTHPMYDHCHAAGTTLHLTTALTAMQAAVAQGMPTEEAAEAVCDGVYDGLMRDFAALPEPTPEPSSIKKLPTRKPAPLPLTPLTLAKGRLFTPKGEPVVSANLEDSTVVVETQSVSDGPGQRTYRVAPDTLIKVQTWMVAQARLEPPTKKSAHAKKPTPKPTPKSAHAKKPTPTKKSATKKKG
jgi:hypothetical protein